MALGVAESEAPMRGSGPDLTQCGISTPALARSLHLPLATTGRKTKDGSPSGMSLKDNEGSPLEIKSFPRTIRVSFDWMKPIKETAENPERGTIFEAVEFAVVDPSNHIPKKPNGDEALCAPSNSKPPRRRSSESPHRFHGRASRETCGVFR